MARDRLQLHETLCDILGSSYCYFNPPANVQMKYPCIKYEVASVQTISADDLRYKNDVRYQLTVIDRKSESRIVQALYSETEKLRHLRLDRVYAIDGLYHYVFTLFY